MDLEDYELTMSSAEREGKRNGAIGMSGCVVSRLDVFDVFWLMNM